MIELFKGIKSDWNKENKTSYDKASLALRIGGIALGILAAGLAIAGLVMLTGGSIGGIGLILASVLTAFAARDCIVMGNNSRSSTLSKNIWDNTYCQAIGNWFSGSKRKISFG